MGQGGPMSHLFYSFQVDHRTSKGVKFYMAALFCMCYEICSWPEQAQIYMELPWTYSLIITVSRMGGTTEAGSFFLVSLAELSQRKRGT